MKKIIVVSSLFLGFANMAIADTFVAPIATDADSALITAPALADETAKIDTLTGFYLGLNIGFSNDRFSANVAPTFSGKKSFSNLSLGFNISYLYQFTNNFVLGAEFDNTFDLGKTKKNFNIIYNGVPLQVKRNVYVPSFLATLGYKVDRLMPFIKVGATYLKQEYSFSSDHVDKKSMVPTAGVGVDYRYTNRTNLRLEALYNFRQKVKSQEINANAKYQRYNIKLGILYRI